jgi:phosphate starvation-inducible PhoH-like protein
MGTQTFHTDNNEASPYEMEDMLTDRQLRKLEKKAKQHIIQNANNKNSMKDKSPKIAELKQRVEIKFPLVAKTAKQKALIRAIIENMQTVTIGSAGTGKTYVTAAMAAEMLVKKEVERIIITRPNVPSGKSIGFFPGTLDEKMGPWLEPIISVLKEKLGITFYEYLRKTEAIDIVPFEVIRGRSFNDAFVILDEAENTTVNEMKAFLTRIGEGSKVVINGDIKQTDIKERSGLDMVICAIESNKKIADETGFVEFTIDDVVRADIVATWLRHFDKHNI